MFSPERARLIAVTEVTRAYAEGNRQAWKASGVIEEAALADESLMSWSVRYVGRWQGRWLGWMRSWRAALAGRRHIRGVGAG